MITTYHGLYFKHGENPEENGPEVPIEIEAFANCLRLRLGSLKQKPGVMVERQTDRWSICIAKDDDADNDLMVYIMDNGKIVVVPGYLPNDVVNHADDIPERLPWSDVKYKTGLNEPKE